MSRTWFFSLFLVGSLTLVGASAYSVDKTEPTAEADGDEVPTSKQIETNAGTATISVEEKKNPEPALKPFLLQVSIKCKGGKMFRQSVSVCDSDLSHNIEGDSLKVSYFYALPEALGTDQEEEDLECDEENPYELEIKLSEACSGKSSKSKSDKSDKSAKPAKADKAEKKSAPKKK